MTDYREIRREAVSRVVGDILLHDRFADEQDRADAMTAAIVSDLPDHGFMVVPTNGYGMVGR